MHLDDLNNSQIILLVILLTVLLSLATTVAIIAKYGGIDKPIVSHTVNRIIERTIEKEPASSVFENKQVITPTEKISPTNKGTTINTIKSALVPIYLNNKISGYGVAIDSNKIVFYNEIAKGSYIKIEGKSYKITTNEMYADIENDSIELEFLPRTSSSILELGSSVQIYELSTEEKYIDTYISKISTQDKARKFYPLIPDGYFDIGAVVISSDGNLIGFLGGEGDIELVLE